MRVRDFKEESTACVGSSTKCLAVAGACKLDRVLLHS